jgi:phasin family protein
MAKKGNPFLDMDVTKVMGDFKVPQMDLEALMAYHRRNFETFAAFNQVAVEGLQAMARCQGEIARSSAESCGKAATDILAAGTPEEKATQQADFLKAGFTTAMANYQTLSETVTVATAKATDVIAKRVTESLDEVKGLVVRNGATK